MLMLRGASHCRLFSCKSWWAYPWHKLLIIEWIRYGESYILYVILRFTTMKFIYCILSTYVNDNVELGEIIETFGA